MKTYLPFYHLLFFIFSQHLSFAQTYTKSENISVVPSKINGNNYTPLFFDIESKGKAIFDLSNLYTYLQIIDDINYNSYHILYQTDFVGNITFIALSNNLMERFNYKKDGFIGYNWCIRKIKKDNFSIETTNAIIDCILTRLNAVSN